VTFFPPDSRGENSARGIKGGTCDSFFFTWTQKYKNGILWFPLSFVIFSTNLVVVSRYLNFFMFDELVFSCSSIRGTHAQCLLIFYLFVSCRSIAPSEKKNVEA